MKVHELIARLSTVDPNTEVLLSKDGEGNDYRPLDSWGTDYVAQMIKDPSGSYVRDVELRNTEDLCDLECDGADHEPEPCGKAPEGSVPALVLWPTY